MSLATLETLDLSSNVIGVLKKESLQGLPALATLKLARNELSRVGESAFKEATGVRHLDLSGNRFAALGQETFRPLKDLRSLNLADNQLEDLNGMLQTQVQLRALNISGNRLSWFDYAFVPPSVVTLDIAFNRVDALGNYYNLLDNYGLRVLRASGNRIRELTPSSVLASVEEVDLSDNLVEHVADGTFVGKYSLRTVSLEGNRLRTLSEKALMVTPQTETPVFHLRGNPLACDCHLQWLKRTGAAVPGGAGHALPRIADFARLECSLTNHTGHREDGQRLAAVADSAFVCPYESHCLPACLCCDFLACDCQAKCPAGCKCFRDGGWDVNVVQCSAGGFDRVPEVVPMDTTVLYLDDNDLGELTAGALVGRTRLRSVSAVSSGVAAIANQTFAGLDALEHLDLSYNRLKHLYGHEFDGLVSLRELFLQHNQLVSMAPNVFKNLRYNLHLFRPNPEPMTQTLLHEYN
jgi:Leucine-rich repeat (LRR) protein